MTPRAGFAGCLRAFAALERELQRLCLGEARDAATLAAAAAAREGAGASSAARLALTSAAAERVRDVRILAPLLDEEDTLSWDLAVIDREMSTRAALRVSTRGARA